MRTTVEMKPEHRSALPALASRRGQKGFSAGRQTLLALAGSLSEKDADALRHSVRELREEWR